MEAIVAIIGGIIALFFYNKVTKAKVLNDDTVKPQLDALKQEVERMNKDKAVEEKKREDIERQIEQDSKDVPADELVDFFNKRNK